MHDAPSGRPRRLRGGHGRGAFGLRVSRGGRGALWDWKSVVETDPRYLRPTEVDYFDGEVFENPEDTSSLTA